MRTKRRALLIGLCLAALCGIVWSMALLREPSYKGKPIRTWVNYELHDDVHGEWGWRGNPIPNPRFRQAYTPKDTGFTALLNERPAEVLPYLISALKTGDSRTRHVYQWLLNHLPGGVSRHLPSLTPPSHIRSTAAAILGSMGPAAKDAVPALCNCLSKDPTHYEKYLIIQAIVAIGPEGKAAVPTFVALLQKDPEAPVRASATVELGLIRSDAIDVVPALTKALHDPNQLVRMYAMMALSQFGPDAKSAEEPLNKLAASTNIYEAQQAREVLQKIAPVAPVPEAALK